MKWRWGNVPVPPQHLLGLMVGGGLEILRRRPLWTSSWMGSSAGLILSAIGIVLAAWAVHAAGLLRVEAPTRLLTGGPYALSRNPMYVAWTFLYTGLFLAVNSFWIAVLLPPVMIFTDLFDIRREERQLEQLFGEAFLRYKKRVRRYF